MSKTYHIFIPEYVPLENKGEEAIIRGIGDVLFPEDKVEFHILDMEAKQYQLIDGLHVYPGTWFYARWRSQEFGLALNPQKIYASICSLLRNGLNIVFPSWLKIPQKPVRKTANLLRKIKADRAGNSEKVIALRQIMACDYLIAGHDGALNEYDCHIIDMMSDFGMKFGIFGTSMKPNVTNQTIIEIFRNTLERAEFIYCRNPIAYNWAKKHFSKLDIQLAPDPAFGMRPSKNDRIDDLIRHENLVEFFKKPVVMITSAEPAPIARHCFSGVSSRDGKINAHRDLLSSLVRHITETYEANVLFLPHAIGPGQELDDRLVAKDVLRRANLPTTRATILETEYPARILKALIGRAHILVAERIHSMIGATGVHTAFCCLGSKTDGRVRGIVGEMLGMEDVIYYLNSPKKGELCEYFDRSWKDMNSISTRLVEAYVTIDDALNKAATSIRKKLPIQE